MKKTVSIAYDIYKAFNFSTYKKEDIIKHIKRKKRYKAIALLIAVIVMIFGILPNGFAAPAEECAHTHTENCYAKAGDLLCTTPETQGHIHDESCYCPGGEFICGLDESQGHTHEESCYKKRTMARMVRLKGSLYANLKKAKDTPTVKIAFAKGANLYADLKNPKDILTAKLAMQRAESLFAEMTMLRF